MNRGVNPLGGDKQKLASLSDVSGSPTYGSQLVYDPATRSFAHRKGPRFNPMFHTYNFTGATMSKWRTAYAKARNGEGRAHLACLGDSITAGYRGTSPSYANSWPALLRTAMDAKTGVVSGTGFVKPIAAEEDAGENRFVLGGTWPGSRGTGLFASDRYSATGGTLTIGPIICDRIRVYYLKYSGGGTSTVTLDGGAATSINCNAGSLSVNQIDYTATSGSHTLVITAPTGSDFVLLGWEAWQNGTTTGVRVSNIGYNGKQASQFYTASMNSLGVTGGQLYDLLAPDLSIVCFGANEMNLGVSPDAFYATLAVAAARITTGSVVLLPPPPIGLSNGGAAYSSYVSAYYALADSAGYALIDWSDRWIDNVNSNAQGLMFDGQHPDQRGYYDAAQMVIAALVSML